jgi:hypothetical protein
MKPMTRDEWRAFLLEGTRTIKLARVLEANDQGYEARDLRREHKIRGETC